MLTRTDRQPENLNYLQENKFIVTFTRIPHVQFLCNKVNLPGIRSDRPQQVTMGRDAPLPGSKASYDEFSMQFYVDEDLVSWLEIYNWIHDYSTIRGSKYYSRLNDYSNHSGNGQPQYSDCSLMILDDRNYPKYRVDFSYVFPTSVTGIQFDSTVTDIRPIYATAMFGYTDFSINFIGKSSQEVTQKTAG